MSDSPDLDPTNDGGAALTGPEIAAPIDPAAGPSPLPSPAGRSTPAGERSAATGPLTLETSLLGPLSVPDGAGRAAEIEELSRRAARYATRAKGDGTRRAYRAAWQQYAAWCAGLGREPLAADPDTIAMYVVRCADQGFAVSSIRVHLAAIKTAHLLAGLSLDLRHPRLAMVVEGVTRATGIRPRRQAAPAVPGVLRLLLAARPAPDTPLGARDRAMLLLGFGAALRRAELVALTIGDVAPVPGRGLLLTIARSKTDQHGAGQRVAVHANPAEPGCCPAAALEAWLRHRRDGARSRLDRQRQHARRTPVVLRRHQGGHRHRPGPVRQGGGAAGQAGRRGCRARRGDTSRGTRCGAGCSPPGPITAPSSPN